MPTPDGDSASTEERGDRLQDGLVQAGSRAAASLTSGGLPVEFPQAFGHTPGVLKIQAAREPAERTADDETAARERG